MGKTFLTVPPVSSSTIILMLTRRGWKQGFTSLSRGDLRQVLAWSCPVHPTLLKKSIVPFPSFPPIELGGKLSHVHSISFLFKKSCRKSSNEFILVALLPMLVHVVGMESIYWVNTITWKECTLRLRCHEVSQGHIRHNSPHSVCPLLVYVNLS